MALQLREVTRPDWDGVVVEIREEGEPLGQVFADGPDLLVEWFSPAEGAPVLEVSEVIRVLEVAAAILAPEPPGALPEPVGEDPIEILSDEFDAKATLRGAEDEGFFPTRVAAAILARCSDLGMAVVRLEGVRKSAGTTVAVPGCLAEIGEAHRGEQWPTFVAGCNVQADALLGRWARNAGLLLAIEVEDAGGEVFIL